MVLMGEVLPEFPDFSLFSKVNFLMFSSGIKFNTFVKLDEGEGETPCNDKCCNIRLAAERGLPLIKNNPLVLDFFLE